MADPVRTSRDQGVRRSRRLCRPGHAPAAAVGRSTSAGRRAGGRADACNRPGHDRRRACDDDARSPWGSRWRPGSFGAAGSGDGPDDADGRRGDEAAGGGERAADDHGGRPDRLRRGRCVVHRERRRGRPCRRARGRADAYAHGASGSRRRWSSPGSRCEWLARTTAPGAAGRRGASGSELDDHARPRPAGCGVSARPPSRGAGCGAGSRRRAAGIESPRATPGRGSCGRLGAARRARTWRPRTWRPRTPRVAVAPGCRRRRGAVPAVRAPTGGRRCSRSLARRSRGGALVACAPP